MGLEDDEVVSSPLVDMYIKCGKLENAHRVFEQLGSKDLISWTSIVLGYETSGKTREANKLFDKMSDAMLSIGMQCWQGILVPFNVKRL